MKKINLYLFSQIAKSCTLIFFIFISIAWLLQFSRLINVMSHLHINTLEILYLSLLIVPNLTNVTMPFILIFGFVLSFIKLSRDREIMAIYSSGISINEIIKPLIIISFLFVITSLILSFIISPKIYDYYKKSEFNLRNTIQFEKIDVSNFIKFNENLTIDFEKYNSGFKNILINIDEESEILIFAKKGQIDQTNDRLTFKLIEGFKTEIKENSIENLNFDSYFIDFPIDEKKLYKKSDPNTLDLFELLNENKKSNNVIILLRIIDSLIILSLSIFFYFNIIKENNYSLINQSIFIVFGILCLTIDNLLENFVFVNDFYIIIMFLNLFTIHLFLYSFKFLMIYK